MDTLELLQAQLLDPFRVGLMLALMATTIKTSSQTGRLVPLALGAVFVAVLIAINRDGDRWTMIGVGVVANAILLAVMLAAVGVWNKLASRSR